MALVTYHVRLYHLKLYPLEALEVGIGAPFAKPRAALSTAHAAADKVTHDKNVIFTRNAAKRDAALHNPSRILYNTCVSIIIQRLRHIGLYSPAKNLYNPNPKPQP